MGLIEKLKNKVYIIAEMSANHSGKLENALEIVRQAKLAGADCVKIQTYTANTITIDCDSEDFQIKGGLWDGYTLYDLYNQAYTPWEWHAPIKKKCEEMGIDFLSTPFDKTAVDYLEDLGVESYKIASYELVDIPLISYIAKKGKPIIMSCGMGSKEEIWEAIEACYKEDNTDIVLLKCCSEYPAILGDMNLATINYMKEEFKLPVGLSDHSQGYMADIIAVAAGAEVIEKHVRLDNDMESADSGFSMPMKEFAEMVKKVRETEMILGRATFELSPTEKSGMTARRSLYIVEDIKKGDVFTEKNIKSIRPAYGLSPKFYNDIIGKRVNRDVKKGTPLSWELLQQ